MILNTPVAKFHYVFKSSQNQETIVYCSACVLFYFIYLGFYI